MANRNSAFQKEKNMLCFDYFSAKIKNPEVDSMLLPDTTELSEKELMTESSMIFCAHDEILEASTLPQKLSAWLILLSKYTGAKDAVTGFCTKQACYPVYADFASIEQSDGLTEYIEKWIENVSALEDIDTFSIDALMKELELQPMPLLYVDEASFDNTSVGENDVKLAVLLKEDSVVVKYDAHFLLQSTVDRFVRAYFRVLNGVAENKKISAISMLDDRMTDELNGFLDNAVNYDAELSVVDLLEKAIADYPERTAIVYKNIRITYKELGEQTDRIAAYIRSMGIGAEDVVSILIGRSHLMPITAIGVLKAGAAYQPLDSTYPVERLNFMMKDANAKLLIAEKELLSRVSEYTGDILLTDEIAHLPEAGSSVNFSDKNSLFILLYTSGSTGVPKGVMLEHSNLTAFIHWYNQYYQLDENSRAAAYASFGFDADMMDMYPILTVGGELHIIEEAIRLDLIKLNRYFEDNQISHIFITTQVGRQYAQMFGDSAYPKHLTTGGETLVPIAPPKGFEFFNAYGPTECTIFTTTYRVDRMYKNVPIGKALDNLHLYVVDSDLNRLPVGVSGELCIAGPQVARGYLNRKEQTEAAFVRNPFDNTDGYSRMYRTGDIVRFLSDGNVEFVGRRDSQVKIRGFRIELSEVEEIIRKYEPVKDATVLAFDEPGGGKYIAAYIVSDQKVDIADLNRFIGENKPPYMIPAVTMQIEKIPLNQNQKVDRKALPKPERQVLQRVMPENESQAKIYDILKNILSHEDFGITTPFAEAGLTSIASIRLIVELTRELGVPVTTQDLKEHDTVKSLDEYLASAENAEFHEERDRYPLTQTQMGIYVECLRNPESVQYNLPGAFTLSADTDIDKLERAVHTVIEAHPSVKCVIHEDDLGDIYMYPKKDADFAIEIVEGSEEEWDSFFKTYARPFDMRNELLFRFTFYKTQKHLYLVLDFHHIISDGSSIAAFTEELDRVLTEEKVEGEIFSQYDVACIEEKNRAGEDYAKAKAFYDGIYSGISAPFSLSGDLNDEKEGCGFCRIFDQYIDKVQVEGFCKKHRITENVFFTSVMGYVMGQYNHSEEAVFTTVYHGRKDSRSMNTFGMFVKTLPVYCYFTKDMTAADYMAKAQSQLLDSMQNDIYSFAEICNAYKIRPEIMFVYQGDDFVEFEIDGQKTVFREAVPDKAKANISVNIFVENNRYRFEFEYMSHIYSKCFIERFYDIFITAAGSFLNADRIGDISILSEKEEARIEKFNDTGFEVEIKSVNRLFEAWVRTIPEQTAVIACGEKLSYRELNEKANKVANGLLKRGSEMNTLVGLILERDKNVYITRQGILKAGGGFLPLVTEYPDDRIDFCLRDGNCRFVITTEAIKAERKSLFEDKPYEVLTVEELLADETVSKENPELEISPSNIAYCLYTSGSTGNPKGVLIEHGTLCNFVHSNPKNIEVENYTKNGKVSLAFAAITFDVSVMEEFIPLTNGMTICMANDEEIHNPTALAELLLTNHVDIMKCTPSFMMSIVDIPQMKDALSRIKAFDIGAEAFPPVLYDKMRAVNPAADIINSYGPTECTVSCTSKLLTESGNVNIGGPLANMKLYVVNETNHSLPVGISGELIICGAGVGRGYMNLPDKTREAFFTYKGMRAYHSGDLVKWNDEGEIVFLGRIDNQVKLRGLRIELDEVENAIGSFAGIRSCKVVVKKNGNDEYLAAYYTASTEIDKEKLTEHISSKLAHYMVPGALMQLDEMPLTNHGKIDKKRLPEIAYTAEQREYVAPETPVEKELCEKYQEILSIENVGVTNSFFEIGGTSLSATKVVMFCNSRGYNIVYKDIFSNPSPRMLARLIESKSSEKAEVPSGRSKAADFDFGTIEDTISCNVFKPDMKIRTKKVKNILLTGVTGFLGIHMLKELIGGEYGKIYCLMRKGRYAVCEKRLTVLYIYYFNEEPSQEEWNHIECINADITDENLSDILSGLEFDVIINCAACVKHFVNDDLLDRTNVQGVKNLIRLALHKGSELIQISTTSVAGEGNADTVTVSKQMKENELYFGQILENDYIRTKFLAECAVLSAVKNDGLKAKIIRLGNLMSRMSDGEFQINFVTNGFMRSLRGYKILGKFPLGAMHSPAEFSPIDSTAKSIVTLMQCDEPYTVFHAFNSHRIYMADVIYAMKDFGFGIDVVSDEEFAAALKDAEKDESLSSAVLGLIAYNSSDDIQRYEIGADNRFTAEVLYRMNYKWPITDDEYLRKSIKALTGLGFFD